MPGWLDSAPTLTAEQTTLTDLHLVGNYAVSPHWADGHKTGYYPFRLLRDRCPCPECTAAARRAAGAHAQRPQPAHTRSTDDRRHDPVRRRPSHRRQQGHGLRARRPEPRARRQPDGRPALAGRRRDPRVHEPARGHPPPGARPARPQRHVAGANAILSMRFDSSELSGTMSEIVAYGTAVIVEGDRTRRPRTRRRSTDGGRSAPACSSSSRRVLTLIGLSLVGRGPPKASSGTGRS